MAERRMYAKTIVLSDAFLDMPASARCLYFTLGMLADDDGFVNSPRSIMRQSGASDDDMKILIAKKFVLLFDSGVIVIKHWRVHNYIQKDRRKPTKYVDEQEQLLCDSEGIYHKISEEPVDGNKNEILTAPQPKKPLTEAQQKRLDAKKESSLPYSFEYKIRSAFVGEKCPICGCTMSYNNNLVKPTIQHNKPISLGGKHELDNISVICSSCNASIQNKEETPPYNTELVKEIWECIGNVSGMDTQVRLGKDRLDKVSIGEVSGSSTVDTPIEVQAAPTQESSPPTTTARISRECYSELVKKYGKQFVDTKAYRANNDEVLRKWCEEDAHNGRGAIRVNTNAAAAREKFRERERATADDLAYLKSVQDMVKGASV